MSGSDDYTVYYCWCRYGLASGFGWFGSWHALPVRIFPSAVSTALFFHLGLLVRSATGWSGTMPWAPLMICCLCFQVANPQEIWNLLGMCVLLVALQANPRCFIDHLLWINCLGFKTFDMLYTDCYHEGCTVISKLITNRIPASIPRAIWRHHLKLEIHLQVAVVPAMHVMIHVCFRDVGLAVGHW